MTGSCKGPIRGVSSNANDFYLFLMILPRMSPYCKLSSKAAKHLSGDTYPNLIFFCFSTWGESLFKAIQTCFLVMLLFYYTNRPLAAVLFPFLYGAIVYVLLSGLTPIVVLVQLVSLNILFLTVSRVSLYEPCQTVLITRVIWPIKSDRKNGNEQ